MYRANKPVVEVLDTLIQACTGSKVDLGRIAAGKSMANWGLKVRWRSNAFGFDTLWHERLESVQQKTIVFVSSTLYGEAKNYWGCGSVWKQEIDVLKYDSIAWKLTADSMLEVTHSQLNQRVFWYKNGALMADSGTQIKFANSVDTMRFRACTGVDGSCKYCTEEWVVVPKMNQVDFLTTNLDGIQLFPNPVVDRLYLKCNQGVKTEKFYIADLCGRKLSPEIIIEKSGHNEVAELDVSLLKNGVYMLMGIGQDGRFQQLGRFVK